jgi:hypothetical protein
MILGFFAICTWPAHAQTPPYALLQNATLTGSGNTITAVNIPVVISVGVIVYVSLNLQFNVDSNGNFTVTPGYPQITQSFTPLASNFVAGNYVGPSNINSGNNLVTVSGPGITSGGATEWSLAASAGGSNYTYPPSATWYVGPIASNPIASRLQSAGITSTAYSYGVTGGNVGNIYWEPNTLIGVSQIGNTITLVSFSYNGNDRNVPQDQITYTLSH